MLLLDGYLPDEWRIFFVPFTNSGYKPAAMFEAINDSLDLDHGGTFNRQNIATRP